MASGPLETCPDNNVLILREKTARYLFFQVRLMNKPGLCLSGLLINNQYARVPRTKCPEDGVKSIEAPKARSHSDTTLLYGTDGDEAGQKDSIKCENKVA
jgi:hypothetical protein